jgi:hypothetical protein
MYFTTVCIFALNRELNVRYLGKSLGTNLGLRFGDFVT